MNEKINSILTQAGFDVDSLVRMGLSDQIEKAFELVIKETTDLIKEKVSFKYIKDENCGMLTEEFMGGHYSASIEARAAIKQYFGYKDENKIS